MAGLHENPGGKAEEQAMQARAWTPGSARQAPLRRALWSLGGWLAAGLGLVGVALPLVPATPFLLLAATCFARSSPRAHRWLLENRWCGPLLRQWHETRSVPRSAKRKGYLVLIASFGVSIALAPSWPLRALLAILALALLSFLARLPEGPG